VTTYDYERLWFNEITTEGKFPRGSIAMEVAFEDDDGEKYVWTPKWEEIQNLYATAERVEEVNEGGGQELEQLKTLQQFSGPTLKRLAKCINYHTSLEAIRHVFADTPTVRGRTPEQSEVNQIFVDAGVEPPDYPDRYNLADRWKFIRDRLRELNREDYQHIIDIIEVLVHRNRHVDAEERRRTNIEQLNKVLNYENMEIMLDGKVRMIRAGDDKSGDS